MGDFRSSITLPFLHDLPLNIDEDSPPDHINGHEWSDGWLEKSGFADSFFNDKRFNDKWFNDKRFDDQRYESEYLNYMCEVGEPKER
ncbi:hypothetical protein [Vibrio gazogenes]|uniref:hypothetical protein n=1 Tax=Vibrio gazogenes TaxID=687 RepID=UPI000932AF8F|nr:hypothetical protein [Vibrio gazogenes]USP13248.1 hypothetical protein MKS89_12635 [Vibrio gazogenes]